MVLPINGRLSLLLQIVSIFYLCKKRNQDLSTTKWFLKCQNKSTIREIWIVSLQHYTLQIFDQTSSRQHLSCLLITSLLSPDEITYCIRLWSRFSIVTLPSHAVQLHCTKSINWNCNLSSTYCRADDFRSSKKHYKKLKMVNLWFQE